mgnify:CR=1 FL=1
MFNGLIGGLVIVLASMYPMLSVFVPVIVDRQAGLAALTDLKNRYDRDPVGIKMDLDNRRVFPEEPGFGLNVYESLAVVETRARKG